MEYNEGMNLGRDILSGAEPLAAHDSSPTHGLPRFSSLEDVLRTLKPELSVQCMHPDRIAAAARLFVERFPGDALYAVKSNPNPYLLQQLYAAGIRHFDVASINEVKLIRSLFGMDAHLAFMHPIKSREAIRAAYFEHAVRDFVIDTPEELHKLMEETGSAADLGIIVRIDMPKGTAAYSLAGKFGCAPDVAAPLLQAVDKVAQRTGISFHVGSQTLDPASYATAIRKAGEVMRRAGVRLDILDVGGGFPVSGMGMEVPPTEAFFDVIRAEIAALGLPGSCRIWSEPGRALSGTSTTLLVRVELRKGDALYINDGYYGNMMEVATGKWRNAVRMLRTARRGRRAASRNLAPFRFWGPTCDSIDHMQGPFMLPDDIGEGDWIAIESMGSYMAASSSSFNGFRSDLQVEVAPETSAPIRKRVPKSKAHLTLVKTASTMF